MLDYKNKTVLLTGATGFLAHHLIPCLLNKGAFVVGISLDRKPDENLQNYTHFNIDLKNKEGTKRLIKDIKPSKIFHLASYPDKEPSFENTDECIQNNIQGTLNLIHSLDDISYDSFIHVGSYKEYSANEVPFKEGDALYPISSYAISKASAEMFCIAYHKLYGFPLVSVRFPTLYGPGQPDTSLVTSLIKAALSGTNLKLTKGEQKRELLYISDAVEALSLIAINKKAIGEIINIGSGEECSIKEIVSTVLKLIGSKAKAEWGALPYRRNEIWEMRGDISKAKSLIRWKPKVGLEEGLKRTMEFYKNVK